jgi:hypothetical protein
MKRELLIISTLVGVFSLTTGHALAATFTGSMTYSSTASGTATAGTVRNADGTEKKDQNGMPIPTTPADLSMDKGFAGQYDGATEFKADYMICLDANNMLDMAKSMVTFKTINYTSRTYNPRTGTYGRSSLVNSNFTTPSIKITGVKFMNNDPTMGVESFDFASDLWYPKTEPQGNSLVNNGLSGTINFKTNKSSYKASFIRIPTGSVYTYTVNGMKKQPSPFPDPAEDPRSPYVFSPPESVPEPNSNLSLLALGTLGAASTLKRQLKPSQSIEKETTKVC